MPRRHHQHVGRPGQPRERIVFLRTRIERHIDRHLALILEIDAALIEHLGRLMHLGGPLRHRVAKGREGQEGNARLQPHVAGDVGGALGDIGQVVLVWPFMHQRIGDQHDAPLVQHRGNADSARARLGVKDVVDQFQHMRRLARGPRDQPVAMTMGQHQGGEHVPVAGGQPVNVLPVKSLALQPFVEELLVGLQMLGIGGVDDREFAHGIGHPLGGQLVGHIVIAPDHQRLAEPVALIHHRGAQHARVIAFGKDHRRLRRAGAVLDAAQDRGGRVHPGLERLAVAFHVDDRSPGNAGSPCRPGPRRAECGGSAADRTASG